MHVLALETSMGACSAALLTGGEDAHRLILREERMTRGHAEALMPMVAEVMAEGELDFSQLDLLAATLGPGSFTGVRIAIAAARGIALATNAKLWGTDSLTVMARAGLASGAVETSGRPFAIAVDARASMLYLGLFDAGGERQLGPLLVETAEAANMVPPEIAVLLGSGAGHLAAAAEERGLLLPCALPDLQPSAAHLAELAVENGETLPALRPLYLRPPDAKAQTNAAIARR